MPITQRRWFRTLTLFIMIFTLVWLFSVTKFVFTPILKYISAVAFPIIGAGILFYLTKPVMHFLEKLKVHRTIAILIIFVLLTGVGALFITYIAPIAERQFQNIVKNIPKMAAWVQDFIAYSAVSDNFFLDKVHEGIGHFKENIDVYIENGANYLFGFIGQLIGFVTSLVLIPFFLFFMLKDGDKLVPFITQIFSKKKAENLKRLLGKIDTTLTAFIQGQLIVSFFLGILLLIGYWLVGLNYALTLALFGMLMNVVPFIGPFIAVIPALLVGAFQDPIMVVWVALITLVCQQFESNFISPNVMGRALALHPLTVITVILAAGSIAGFIGILFAVPVYAVVRTIFVHFYTTYRESKPKDEHLI